MDAKGNQMKNIENLKTALAASTNSANADFILQARKMMPDLIAATEALQRVLAEAEHLCKIGYIPTEWQFAHEILTKLDVEVIDKQ